MLLLPKRGKVGGSKSWSYHSGVLPLSKAPPHCQLCFYVLDSSMGPFIYLLGVLWRNHSHGSLNLLGLSTRENDGPAVSAWMSGSLMNGANSFSLMFTLIWEATSEILFTFSHRIISLDLWWGLSNLKEYGHSLCNLLGHLEGEYKKPAELV